jgi:hypothetical protein
MYRIIWVKAAFSFDVRVNQRRSSVGRVNFVLRCLFILAVKTNMLKLPALSGVCALEQTFALPSATGYILIIGFSDVD